MVLVAGVTEVLGAVQADGYCRSVLVAFFALGVRSYHGGLGPRNEASDEDLQIIVIRERRHAILQMKSGTALLAVQLLVVSLRAFETLLAIDVATGQLFGLA